MTYRILGLEPHAFAGLFDMTDRELAAERALRVTADKPAAYPCRITLEEAEPGESLLLLNHVSNDVAGPFRTSHAIYVREGATAAAHYRDRIPLLLDKRTLGLRGFDSEGMLRGALLAPPGDADAGIRELFESPEIAVIHAHNAALGCFLAKIERD